MNSSTTRSILADVLEILENQVDQKKVSLDCTGGGRIRVNPQTRTISVYGYSQVSGEQQQLA